LGSGMTKRLRPDDDDDTLKKRAFAAHCRLAALRGWIYTQPGWADSCTEKHNGKRYVVLRNMNGTLAVYRIRPNGALKGLKRYPKAFDQ
jgi:hypothetical protein